MDISQKYVNDLSHFASKCGVQFIAREVYNDPRFLTHSGSHLPDAHHYGKGGLLRHTWEVVCLAMQTFDFYVEKHPNLDRSEVYLSALFHDYGKIWDYTYDEVSNTWVVNSHRRLIHHIQRSAFEWQRISKFYNLDGEFIDRVTHNILSHHGSRQYGSPVAPFTREAYIVHLCDCISARVDDCDRLDMIKVNAKPDA